MKTTTLQKKITMLQRFCYVCYSKSSTLVYSMYLSSRNTKKRINKFWKITLQEEDYKGRVENNFDSHKSKRKYQKKIKRITSVDNKIICIIIYIILICLLEMMIYK